MSFVSRDPQYYLRLGRGEHCGSRGKNPLFPEGPVVKCYTSRLKNRKKNSEKTICLTPTAAVLAVLGSQTELSWRNDTIIVYYFAATKNEDNTEVTYA